MESRRTQVFGTLCGLVFLVNLARIVFAPLVEPLRASFGLSAGAAGLLVTVAWLGSALPRLPAGYALTKFPRHWLVLFAGVVGTGAAVLTAAAPNPAAIGVGAFLLGLSSGVYFIAANPLVSELFPDRVGRAMGVHGMASQVAAVVAPLLVSAVLLAFTWRAVFVVIAVVGAGTTAAVWLATRRAELPNAGAADRAFLVAVRRQWRLILTGIAIVGAAGLVWNGAFNFYVTYLVEVKGLSEGVGRNVLTLAFAAGVPSFLVAGGLADRLPYVPLLVGIVAGFAVSLAALTLVTNVFLVVGVSLLVSAVIHALFPVIDAYLLDTLPDEHRGSAYAVFSAVMMFTQALGSVTVGGLTDLGIPFDVVFQASAAVVFLVAAGLAVLYPLGVLPAGGRENRRSAVE